MTFDWLDFFNLGKSLLASGKGPPVDESKLRTAIGRMYYAVFGSARDYYTRVKSVRFSYNPDDHDILKREIENEKGARIAHNFHRLRKTRNDADYESRFPGDLEKKTEWQLALAKEVLLKHGLLTP